MKKKQLISLHFFLFCMIIVFNYSCTKHKGDVPAAVIPPKPLCDSLNVKYATDIKPIIQAKCAVNGCHKAGGSGNGDFTTYAGVSAKADAPLGNGSLRKRVIEGQLPAMPATPLAALELQKIDCWLKNGAPDN